MSQKVEELWNNACAWSNRTKSIKAAVLFGSTARERTRAGVYSSLHADVDLHIVANDIKQIVNLDWAREMPNLLVCMKAWRPTSGGVRKCTVIFSIGQMDLVIVPESLMLLARLGMLCGLHRKAGRLQSALNEMASCLHGGFEFIKGERHWGKLYRAVSRLPGVRLNNGEIEERANAALVDILWVLQKLEAGEVVAAQHVLHVRVVDSTLRFWRELRLREALPLPSFGLGRRLESIVDKRQYRSICVNAAANPRELESAARELLSGMTELVLKLVPDWTISPQMVDLLKRHGPNSRQP